jgi:hypothetical protein
METYKITKTIRFKLEAKGENKRIAEMVESIKNVDFNLVTFVSDLKNFIDGMKDYLFYKNRKGDSVIKDKMLIKTEWLKHYAKQEFHDNEAKRDKNARRQTKTIGDFNGLTQRIEERFDEIDNIYADLADDAGAELNERAKRARTGLLLQRLKTKLPFLLSLIENTNDKNETDDLSIHLKNMAVRLQEQLLAGIEKYLPEQSSGLPIAKASFNYYTLNKKPVDYDKKSEDLNKQLKNIDWDFVFKKYNLSKEIKERIKKDVDNYEKLRQKLKNIKSAQKKEFNELMQNKKTFQNLKESNLYLFKDIEEQFFKQYAAKTAQLTELATKLSNQNIDEDEKRKLRSQKEKIAKERGAILKDKFQTWKSFADLYRNVAQKHGRIISTLKGIEKEKTESQMLQYWAVILGVRSQELGVRHKLVLIPKERAADCYKQIAGQAHNDRADSTFSPTTRIPNSYLLFWFESLTYRSLQKLCFGNLETGTNTFNANISDVLRKHSFYETDRFGNEKLNKIEGNFSFHDDDQKKITFYKDVLASRKVQSVLKLPIKQIEDEIINKNFTSLDDFKIALERICYRRYVKMDSNIEETLKNYDAQFFDITSQDLSTVSAGATSDCKKHTQIWKNFWTEDNEQNNFDIRLNPEITITYRESKQSRIEKYGEGTDLYDENKKNRYLHPQFTLLTTISEHCNAPTKVLSFMTDDEFKTSVDEFNKKLNKETVKFAIGIDNGEKELSTLGVYLPAFNKNTIEEKIAELKNVEKYGFKVLEIKKLSYSEKDKNGKERKIIQNPSYFLIKENYMRTFGKTEQEYEKMFANIFEEKTVLSLDLTTAKVIAGHIVTNGDVPTFFNLWLRHAQRNIWDMNDHTDKQTAQKIVLKNNAELTDAEKIKFVEYLFKVKNKLDVWNRQLPDEASKNEYVKWLFEKWDGKKETEEEKRKYKKLEDNRRVGYFSKYILFAVCYTGKDLQSVTEIFDVRNVFKLREDFYTLMSEQEIRKEIENYNSTESLQKRISNEEMDLRINHLKQSLVANAVGVIDFLYKQYKKRFSGEGLIVKEGFDTNKVAEDLEKFSGNIYRILERKLYQKFQNYGLVPPIKSLMSVRAEGIKNNKDAILQLGNIAFIDPDGTSQKCPACRDGKLSHTTNCDKNCGFETKDIMHSNDGIAGYNIAKRGFENFFKKND